MDGNGTADTNGTVDQNTPGTYQIIYSFTDSSGNQAQSVTRTVKVENLTSNQNPVFQSDGNMNSLKTLHSFTILTLQTPMETISSTLLNMVLTNTFSISILLVVNSYFHYPKDFENPEDNNSDNIYEISIIVSDGDQVVPLTLHIQLQTSNLSQTLIPSSPSNRRK